MLLKTECTGYYDPLIKLENTQTLYVLIFKHSFISFFLKGVNLTQILKIK